MTDRSDPASFVDTVPAGNAETTDRWPTRARGEPQGERNARLWAVAVPGFLRRRRPAQSGDPEFSLGIPDCRDFVLIGHGGSSRVYRAHQDRLDGPVAVKVLDIDLRRERDQRKFENECRAVGVLRGHPNIVQVYSAGVAETTPYIVMEYLDGGSLYDRLIETGTLSIEDTLRLGVRLASALWTAHTAEQRIVHRDVKPQNVLYSPYGEPKLTDFGIAALTGEQSTHVTHQLTLVHAAPEVLHRNEATAAGDIYSLASTLFAALNGRAPFAPRTDDENSEEGPAALIARIVNDDPPPIRRGDVPEALLDLLRRGLAKEPVDRPETALAFAHEIQEIQRSLGHTVTEIPGVSATAAPPPPPAELMPSEAFTPAGLPGDTTITGEIDTALAQPPPPPAHAADGFVVPLAVPQPLVEATQGPPSVLQGDPSAVAAPPGPPRVAPVPAGVDAEARTSTHADAGLIPPPEPEEGTTERRLNRAVVVVLSVAGTLAALVALLVGIRLVASPSDDRSPGPTPRPASTPTTSLDVTRFAPTDVTVDDQGLLAVVRWTDQTGGEAHHLVTWEPRDGEKVPVEAGQTEATVAGLDPETPYCFTVSALLQQNGRAGEFDIIEAKSEPACIRESTP